MPHYLGNTTNPAVRRALLTTLAPLLDLELEVAPFEAAVRAFRRQCDQAVAHDATVQAYVRQLEQAYDAPETAPLRPRRDDDGNPEQLMRDLEAFSAPGAGKRHRVTPRCSAGTNLRVPDTRHPSMARTGSVS